MGLLVGLLFQSYDGLNVKDDAPIRTHIRETARFAWAGAKPMARSFGYIGFWYSGLECGAEQARGRNDIYNHVIAGCLTGAGLAWKSGPTAMSLGCAGFAAFSAATEYYFNRDQHD